MWNRLCFILAVLAAIQATAVRKKNFRAKRQAYYNSGISGNYVWKTPVDVEFVLDSSDSVGADNFRYMIQYVQNLVRHWDIGPQRVQVGVVTYGNGARNQFYLNNYQTGAQLVNAIGNIQYQSGAADLGNAFRFAYGDAFTSQHGSRDHVPHVIVHIGNGVSSNKAFTLQEAQAARDHGITIYNVAVGSGVDNNEVQNIATNPASRYLLHADTYQSLDTLVNPLATKIENEVPGSNTMLPQANGCLQKADLVFMIDSSSNVGDAQHQQLEQFLKDFIIRLPIGKDKVQVGLVQYSSHPADGFPLNMYTDRMDLLKAVDTLRYMGGGTNTADALKYMREQAFSSVSGARTDVPRIGIIITNGHSSNPTATTTEADKARSSDIGLIGVGVGSGVDLNELYNIADNPHTTNTFTISDNDQMQNSIPQILNAACNMNRMLPGHTGQGVTHLPDTCQDKLTNCDEYEESACVDYKPWATENCARFCKICTPLYTVTEECKDSLDNCKMYGADVCQKFAPWAHTNCRQYCGFCADASSGFYGQCFYKGKVYKQGDRWDDGCDYECVCESGNTGKYRCYNKCPIYNDLPSQCTLVVTPGQCCLKPVCNFQQKVTTNTGSGIGKTPTGISVCVYDGKQYYQDESWEVGCDFKCSCINAQQGVYSCQSYCPTYRNLPSSCHLTKAPGMCCETPSCDFNQQVGSFSGSGATSGIGSSTTPKKTSPCEDVLPNCNMYDATSCKAPYRQWAVDNCKKTCNLCENGLTKPGPNDVCIYDGNTYHQGEAWRVSCDLECVCEQATFGYYRCSNKCPTYNNIPNGCYTKKKAGDCCETVVCDRGTFVPSTTNLKSIGNGGGIIVTGLGGSQINVPPTFPSGATPGPGTGGTGMQAPTLNGCLYSGNLYVQGQQWTDGCQQTCVCTDATKGLYSCRARCPTYQGIPQNCIMKADPNDPCCKIPNCNPLAGQLPIPVYGPNVQNIGAVQPPSIGDLITGTFTVKHTINFNGGTVAPPTAPSVLPSGTGIGYCEYKGQRYTQGQAWQDGCNYNCVCQDASIGKWKCNDRCLKYENLPKPYCILIQDKDNPCCKVPHCDFTGKYGDFFGSLTPPPVTQPRTQYPPTFPVITTPAPAFCDYKGQKYNQGQMWYDACSFKCTCDNARAGYYRCVNRCPQYDNVPADCTMMSDPQDPMCCKVPKCIFTPTSGGTSGQGNIPTLSPGHFINQKPGGNPSGVGYCEYQGKRYQQGDKWLDGCQLKCECQDEDSGLYKCTERCPRYADMPPQCKLIPDFTDPCCQKPSCDFSGTSGSLSGHGDLKTPAPGYFTPSPGYTGTPIPAYCVYSGAKFFQGDTWNDGCDKRCRCEDSVKGLYVCNDRCPQYGSLPAQCSFIADPKDQCCRVPSCQFVPTQGQITGTMTPNMIPTAVPGKITGQVPTPTTGPDGKTPAPINHCIYKSQIYQQGQEWEDGCDYHCTCQDALNGKYVCKEKCAQYNNLPPQCRLVKDASNPCCMTPNCIFSGTNGGLSGIGQITPKPNVSPSQGTGPTPNPNVTPTPKLPKSVCVYRGQPYTQGQTWFDGCTYKCVCENADQGVYRCDNRCPAWDKLPSECRLVADPKDPFCCTVPKCDFKPHSGHTTGFVLPSVAPGTITGGAVIPTPGPDVTPKPGVSPSPGVYPQPTQAPVPQGVCVYKGKTYQKGQQWQDGCDYNCECLDVTGKYKCTERCPRYGSIPSECRMVQDIYNPCCEKPYCDFTPGHGSISGTGLPGVSPTASPTPKKMCVYNGVAYDKGQTWTDGCQLKCTCEDSVQGVYRCDQRCARYDTVPDGCSLTTDPSDSCCRVPNCSPIPNPTPSQTTYGPGISPSIPPTYGPGINPNIAATPQPYLFPTAPPGKITGQTVNNPDKNHPQNTSVCLYHGVAYTQGQKWTDGCDYQCECTDQYSGKYICTERCSVFLNTPPFCVMAVDPTDNCCKKPMCSPLTGLTPSPHSTPAPTPGVNVSPGVSPTPATGVRPTPTGVCVYRGTTYVQGQQWYDGCTKSCICEDGKTGFYRCSDRCAKYDNLPQQCRMVADPKDPQCCQVPECSPTPGPNGYPTPGPGISPTPSVVTNVPGFVTGVAPTPTAGPDGKTPAPTLACIYKGRTYREGEQWQDGCQYNCVCEDEVTGKYKCTERCAKYPFIPPQCSLRRDTDNDFCCYKMVCDFAKPTVNPYQTPTPGPNQTPAPVISFCMYKGVPYRQGEEWTEGCLQRCRCDDASRDYYTCSNRCPSYDIPPSSTCTQEVDPSDACCRVPHCVQTPTPSPNVGPSPNPNVKPTPNPYPQPTIIPHGTIGGENANKNPLTNQGFCIYKGKVYKQGDRWQDGCDYNCECVDDKSGKYTCTERCNKIASIPAFCNVIQDPYDTCCKKPDCPTISPVVTTQRPNPFSSQTPKSPNPFPTPNPNGTPSPNNVCVYKGQSYTQGQQFFDGCNKKCVCEDSSTGRYSCVDRCPSYSSIAPNCVMVPDPLDPTCCQAPQCNNQPHQTPTGIQGTITGYGKPPTPAPQATPLPGGITPTPGVTQQPTPASGCVYKSKLYTPGQTWADGCDYTCVCEDGMTGKYQCTEKCPKYPNMAPGCRMVADFTNPCCMKPDCTAPTPGPSVKPPLGQTPAPTSSPPLNPSLDFCVYNGVPIKQSQTVNVGCDKVCRCDDAMTGQVNCDDRCATYPQLKPGCTKITDPNDACCQIPKCNSPNTNGNQHYSAPYAAIPGLFRNVPSRASGYFIPFSRFGHLRSALNVHLFIHSGGISSEFVRSARSTVVPSETALSDLMFHVFIEAARKVADLTVPFRHLSAISFRINIQSLHTVQPLRAGAMPPVPDGVNGRLRHYAVWSSLRPNGRKMPAAPVQPGPFVLSVVIVLPDTCVTPDGTLYTKGQTWANGCKETCTCEDSVTNDMRCNQRCPGIAAIPSFCQMVPDPQDSCCKTPSCNYKGTPLTPMIGNKQPTTSPTLSPTITNVLPIGTHSVFSGTGHPPGTVYSTSMGGRDVCVYKGVMHRPGESWDDGCKFTCTCQIKGNGLYTCSDKCPTYPPLPSYCNFVPVVGQCCPSLHCDVPKVGQYHPVPQLNPSLTPSLSPGQAPTMQPTTSPQLIVGPGQGNVFGGSGQPGHGSPLPSNPTIVGGITDKCVYKGKMYNQGEKWDDGCQYSCTCIESMSGFYKCLPKCPTYSKDMLPSGCYMTHAVGQCCDTPVCSKPDGSTVNPLLQPNVYPVYGSFTGGFTGFRPGYTPGVAKTYGGRIDACLYKGSLYSLGQRWTDACDYDCQCIDTSVGQYKCTPKCPTYTKLPPMCKSVSVTGQCCPQVSCGSQNTVPTPSVTPQSGVTGPCIDVLTNCELYADSSCKAPYLDWAKKNCARRCGICYTPTQSTGCQDKLANCASYSKSSCVGEYQQWAKVNCQKYCDLCPGATSTPPTGCADKLNNCHSYSSYSCSGQYEQWARTNCASTCGYCPTGTGVQQGHGGGIGVPATGWTILMKGVAGVPGDLYQLWASPNTASANVPSAQYLTSTYPHSYKPDLSNKWKDCNFDNVKVGIFNNGVEKASIVFDAHGADKMSWFDPSRIISSTWTDIKTAPKSIFSMMGDPITGREFYTSGQSGSSCDASGWMMISTRPGCTYETTGTKPAFYYVPGTTQAKFSQSKIFIVCVTNVYGCTGALFTRKTSMCNECLWVCRCPVYKDLPTGCKMVKKPGECCAKPNCTGPGGASCLYKGNYYTQGQTWEDGCDFKCKCVDASKGYYQCDLKCLQWQLPKVCSMLAPPAGKCCPVPHCPDGYVINYPPNYVQE
ncbi:uncharacterized protein LOC124292144 [Haliotis rubra]|uniref:uncharacterized protein LOC124292144 n=1 Tax=Haliotis rubra TaxID=36100 RepID=UPI001EE58A9C|nr:uncharacterized protein LOC124292144 [Haliotis rubra]